MNQISSENGFRRSNRACWIGKVCYKVVTNNFIELSLFRPNPSVVTRRAFVHSNSSFSVEVEEPPTCSNGSDVCINDVEQHHLDPETVCDTVIHGEEKPSDVSMLDCDVNYDSIASIIPSFIDDAVFEIGECITEGISELDSECIVGIEQCVVAMMNPCGDDISVCVEDAMCIIGNENNVCGVNDRTYVQDMHTVSQDSNLDLCIYPHESCNTDSCRDEQVVSHIENCNTEGVVHCAEENDLCNTELCISDSSIKKKTHKQILVPLLNSNDAHDDQIVAIVRAFYNCTVKIEDIIPFRCVLKYSSLSSRFVGNVVAKYRRFVKKSYLVNRDEILDTLDVASKVIRAMSVKTSKNYRGRGSVSDPRLIEIIHAFDSCKVKAEEVVPFRHKLAQSGMDKNLICNVIKKFKKTIINSDMLGKTELLRAITLSAELSRKYWYRKRKGKPVVQGVNEDVLMHMLNLKNLDGPSSSNASDMVMANNEEVLHVGCVSELKSSVVSITNKKRKQTIVPLSDIDDADHGLSGAYIETRKRKKANGYT